MTASLLKAIRENSDRQGSSRSLVNTENYRKLPTIPTAMLDTRFSKAVHYLEVEDMATKQIVIDLDRRMTGIVSAMADGDCRTIPQQIAWLSRKEAVRRKLLRNVAGEPIAYEEQLEQTEGAYP